MSTLTFHSCLAAELQRFVDLRRAAGSNYQAQARLLLYFDRFLAQRQVMEPRLTRDVTEAYQQTLDQLGPRSRDNRRSVVRQFCEYLSRTAPECYIPERRRWIRPQDARWPYIYNVTEVQKLLAAAAGLPPPTSLRPHTYRTLLGLLYCTGIRIGEAFALNLEDFHGEEQNLYIAVGKFRKARWVSLSGTACDALRQYVERRQRVAPCEPDAPLLLNQRRHRLQHPPVYKAFRQLLSQCGIPHQPDAGPRIHDLRHTFAVHRLLAWYRDGQDVNARLPWLATYLGHVNIQSTQVYLRQRVPRDPRYEQVFLNANAYPLTRFGVRHILRKHVAQSQGKCPSLANKRVSPHTLRHTTAMHLLRSGNEVNMVSYWLGHTDINTTHVYVEIDMEMKRHMLEKAPSPAVNRAAPWRKPGILEWLDSLTKHPRLCAANHDATTESRPSTA